MECFSYEGWCGVHNVYILRHLKEKLACAIDKQLWVISNVMLFTQLYHKETKE